MGKRRPRKSEARSVKGLGGPKTFIHIGIGQRTLKDRRTSGHVLGKFLPPYTSLHDFDS